MCTHHACIELHTYRLAYTLQHLHLHTSWHEESYIMTWGKLHPSKIWHRVCVSYLQRCLFLGSTEVIGCLVRSGNSNTHCLHLFLSLAFLLRPQCNPPVGCRHVTHLHLFLLMTLTKPGLYLACLEQTYRQQHNLKSKLYCDRHREKKANEMDIAINCRGGHEIYSLKWSLMAFLIVSPNTKHQRFHRDRITCRAVYSIFQPCFGLYQHLCLYCC